MVEETAKRPLEGGEEGGGEQESPAKRPRTEGEAPSTKEETSDEKLARALDEVKAATGREDIEIGRRVEVKWVVTETEQQQGAEEEGAGAESESRDLWWGSTITAFEGISEKYGPVWTLTYDRKTVFGDQTFESELRQVSFTGSDVLVDVQTADDTPEDGSETKALMQWRIEGSDHEPPEILEDGCLVRVQDTETGNWYSAHVLDMNPDGTYNIILPTDDVAHAVPRDIIRPVEDGGVGGGGEGVEQSGIIADSIDAFFNLFTAVLMSNPTYERMTSEQKLQAAEKFAELKVPFRQELEKLQAEKGTGYVVGAEDIRDITPRVMQRMHASKAQAAAGISPGPKSEPSC